MMLDVGAETLGVEALILAKASLILAVCCQDPNATCVVPLRRSSTRNP